MLYIPLFLVLLLVSFLLFSLFSFRLQAHELYFIHSASRIPLLSVGWCGGQDMVLEMKLGKVSKAKPESEQCKTSKERSSSLMKLGKMSQ